MNIPPIPYEPLEKIARLSREMIVTEKIDGTQATVFVDESGVVFAASKNKWITDVDDNYGFAKWVDSHREELATLGPGLHRGEWWGSGIQRGYGLAKGEKRFSLFNVSRWCLAGETPKRISTANPMLEKYQDVLPSCCGLVPVLYRGLFTTGAVDDCVEMLRYNGSMASLGFKDPEGVVCFHTAGNFGLKKTLSKDEVPKSKSLNQ